MRVTITDPITGNDVIYGQSAYDHNWSLRRKRRASALETLSYRKPKPKMGCH
jgi:hypothetical protein